MIDDTRRNKFRFVNTLPLDPGERRKDECYREIFDHLQKHQFRVVHIRCSHDLLRNEITPIACLVQFDTWLFRFRSAVIVIVRRLVVGALVATALRSFSRWSFGLFRCRGRWLLLLFLFSNVSGNQFRAPKVFCRLLKYPSEL